MLGSKVRLAESTRNPRFTFSTLDECVALMASTDKLRVDGSVVTG